MADPVQIAVERAQKRLGATLKGKYRLEKLLGIGGMAAVYQACHRNASRVAMKILHTELSVDAEVRHRFLQEGYLANNVEHPGVVRALDDDVSEDGAVFLVMELLEGAALDDLWEEGEKMPPKEVLNIGYQILDVLVAAHQKGIIHRDLKPQNLFCTHDGVVKVLDFGLARLEDSASPGFTKSGQVFGTPAYMPPEQALGRVAEIDAKSDLWAVGATLFSMLSGHFVHDAQTAAEHLIYTATRTARPLASVASGLPKQICAFIDKSLAYHKADRFPDARTMQHALEAAFRSAYGEAIEAARPRVRPGSPAVLPTFSTTVGGGDADATTVIRSGGGGRPARARWLLAAIGAGVLGGGVMFRTLIMGDDGEPAQADAVGSPLAESPTSLDAVASAAAPSIEGMTAGPAARPVASASPEVEPTGPATSAAAAKSAAPIETPVDEPAPPPITKPQPAPAKSPPPLSSQNAFEYQ